MVPNLFFEILKMQEVSLSDSNSVVPLVVQTPTDSAPKTLKLRHVKKCVFPYNFFKTGEEDVIKGVIGQDANIVSIYKHDFILPNNRVVIEVEYESIDFDSFIVYKGVNPKYMNVGSSHVVITESTDIINNIKHTVPVKLHKIVTSPLNDNVNYCYYTIKTLVDSKNKSDFSYYGVQLKSPKQVLHNFSSIFDYGPQLYVFDENSNDMSYTKLINNEVYRYIPLLDQNTMFKNILGDCIDEYNYDDEYRNYSDLTTVVSNDPNSKNDVEYYKKPYNKDSYICVTNSDVNDDFKKIKDKMCNTNVQAYTIDFKDITPSDLRRMIKQLQTGIILLHSKRAYSTLIYLPDKIHRMNVDGICNVIEKDLVSVISLDKDSKSSVGKK